MSKKRMFLYRLQPSRPEMITEGATREEAAIVRRHFEYLKALNEDGVVLLAGRTTNEDAETFGIVIFEAETEERAQEIMGSDPAVIDGVMSASLHPFHIALAGAGLNHL